MTTSQQINRQRSHDAFLARKAAFDALLVELRRMSEDQFGADPDAVLWDHAETLGFYNAQLRRVTDCHFRRGEYATGAS